MPLDQAIEWLNQYRYFALFPLAVIEGPIITVVAGFFASLGYLSLPIAYAIIVAGDLAGDVVYYFIGRFGGRTFIDKWGKYLGAGKEQVELLEKKFNKHGNKLLFIGKLSHGIGGAFLLAAGVIKMPLYQFLMSNLLATFIKSLALLLIGFYFGYAIDSINSYMERVSLITLGIGVATALIYFFYFRKKPDNLPNHD
ncbi:MAG TPA: DedA family protein [Candidatus Portnoybacteria bacterium]|nr:DedA family protein [Candidatus Portnoybacteria bacterium]